MRNRIHYRCSDDPSFRYVRLLAGLSYRQSGATSNRTYLFFILASTFRSLTVRRERVLAGLRTGTVRQHTLFRRKSPCWLLRHFLSLTSRPTSAWEMTRIVPSPHALRREPDPRRLRTPRTSECGTGKSFKSSFLLGVPQILGTSFPSFGSSITPHTRSVNPPLRAKRNPVSPGHVSGHRTREPTASL